ncbi:MAG: alpha/beta hydrolase [Sphaerochaeta sp.]|jgi:acetyl esterase/lipase|nr:alpha/beta hydrolase [Sphaerochaeta sp.]MDD3928850.1 alpha/beta hydrolase [Sphaerochaeta sp.]
MESLLLATVTLALVLFVLIIRIREQRSAASYMSERLLTLMIRQSLIPIRKSLDQLAVISSQPYTLPLGLQRFANITESSFEGMQVFTLGDTTSAKVVLYLHGGAYVEQPYFAHWFFLQRLAKLASCTIVVPLYPKAPHQGASEVLPLLARFTTSLSFEQLILGGDSAGGGLALALAQLLRDEQHLPFSQLFLLSPWLDIELKHIAIDYLAERDPMLDRDKLVTYGKAWRKELSGQDYRVSPLYGSLKDLCPITLFVGTHELFLADARALRTKAKQDGATLEYHEGKKMNHDYPLFPIPEANRVIKRIARLIGEEI